MNMAERVVTITGLSVVGFILMGIFFFQFYGLYEVVGNSMSPTLHDGDIVVVQKDHIPKRGDIILFRYQNFNYMKRIIGLPGDRIEAKQNHIYINHQKLNEPYLKGDQRIGDFGPIYVKKNTFFVLGDHRQTSIDSRMMGLIPLQDIKGKIVWY